MWRWICALASQPAIAILRDLRAPKGARLRRGGRAAEGARLESVYAGNRIAGSNPASSANFSPLTGPPLSPALLQIGSFSVPEFPA